MRMKVLLVLGMVIGTLGFAVERNATTVDVLNISEKGIVHDEQWIMGKVVTNFEVVTKSGNIDDDLKNNSNGANGKLSLPIVVFNNTNNLEVSSPINDIDESTVDVKPQNIILVLSEGIDDENSWEKLKKNHSFAVEGFFQNCKMHNKSNEANKTDSIDNENCDCHKQLNSNIIDLITFARTIKGMNTATVSESNFTTPASLGFDNLAHHHHHHHHHHYHHHHESKSITNTDDIANSSSIHEFYPQSTNDPRPLHMANQLESSMPTKIASLTPNNTHSSFERLVTNNRDRVWDFFNMITKIRLDFLKNIFDSMHESPVFNTNRDLISRKQASHSPIQQSPTFIQFIANTLTDLQAIPNENGFLMIIVAPDKELLAVYEIIVNQPSTKEDLVIISGIDANRDKNLIPYVANGPGSNYFSNLQNIHELASTIKLILSNCQGICKDKEIVPPLTSLPVESLVPKIRVARSEDDETMGDDEKPVEKDVTESDPVLEDTDDDGADEEFEDRPKSSGISFYLKKDFVTLTFSIVSSIIAAFISHT